METGRNTLPYFRHRVGCSGDVQYRVCKVTRDSKLVYLIGSQGGFTSVYDEGDGPYGKDRMDVSVNKEKTTRVESKVKSLRKVLKV